MSDWTFTQGDRNPSVTVTLVDGNNQGVDVSSSTVRFQMHRRGVLEVDGSCTQVNGSLGVVRYDWAAADLDDPGDYEATFEVTSSTGLVQHYPSKAPIPVRVLEHPVTLFDPRDHITWHACWWASDPDWTHPTSGAGVSSWRDASGNSRTLTQATGSLQPLYYGPGGTDGSSFRGRPYVAGDGSNDYLAATWSSVAQPFELWWVGRVVGTGSKETHMSCPAGVSLYKSATETYGIYAGTDVTGGKTNDSVHIWRARFNGASSFLSVDGVVAVYGSAGTNACTGVNLFSTGTPGEYSDAQVAFAGVYNGSLSAASARTLTTGLARLYLSDSRFYGP